ncbi:hypothetical protein [Pelagibius sp. 7325]|uniref:hypothetical protein n=1 Tax=Pelagibius sp. 7325 TaxID=3131994 RepID=UPI0030EC7192
MEAIFFAVDIVAIILLLYWSIINDERKPGQPTTGLFAYRESLAKDGSKPKQDPSAPPPGLNRRRKR